MDAKKSIKMSDDSLKKLQKELDYLVTTRRAEIAQKLKEARAFGDLSENAEYDEAKNEQGLLEARIVELEKTIANAEVVDYDELSFDEVNVGVTVRVLDIDMDEEEELQIVGSNESDPTVGKISDESPIGMALLKKKVGDVVEIEAPGGLVRFKVIEISK